MRVSQCELFFSLLLTAAVDRAQCKGDLICRLFALQSGTQAHPELYTANVVRVSLSDTLKDANRNTGNPHRHRNLTSTADLILVEPCPTISCWAVSVAKSLVKLPPPQSQPYANISTVASGCRRLPRGDELVTAIVAT